MIHLQDGFIVLFSNLRYFILSFLFFLPFFFQGQTMQMMYGIIAQELKAMRIEDAHPQDYLNFYCLGNREELPKDFSGSSVSNNGDTVIKQCIYLVILVISSVEFTIRS